MTELWFLLLSIILVVVCGAFVAVEFALLAVNRSTVEKLAESGDGGAVGILHALRSLSTQLSSVQIGITVTNLGIGYLAEPSIARLITPLFEWTTIGQGAIHGIATVLAITIATATTMVFGELVPKNIAIISPLATLRALQLPLRAFTTLAMPLIKVLNGSANAFLRSRGVSPQEELSSARSADELLSLVRRSAEKGTLTKKTALMLERSLNFRELTALDIMTPRVQVKAVKDTETAEYVSKLTKRTGFSRFPVYRGTVDNIVGVVQIKHAMEVERDQRAHVQVKDLMIEPQFVPSTIELGPLLNILKKGKPHLAVVVDEFGGFDGVVTIEDLLEELVGDMYDEHDTDDDSVIRKIATRTWNVSGLLRPDEIAQSLGYALPEEDDVETIGGLCMHELERVPKKGDVVTIAAIDRSGNTVEVRLKVEKMEGRRVDELVMSVSRPVRGAERSMSIEYSLIIAILSLVGNAFFVGAEFALLSARRTQIELLALKGSAAARISLQAMDDVSLALAGGQLGVTLCSLIFGAISEPLVAHALEPVLEATGMPEYLLHPIALSIALVLMVSIHVVIGEMIPKNLSLSDPTKAALRLVPPLFRFVRIMKPVIGMLNGISNGVVRLLGLKPRREVRSSFSRDEVAGFVKESQREGLITKDEEYRLSGSLDFEYRTIESIILPTKDVVVAPATATAYDIEQLSVQTGFSRFPISNGKGGFNGYVHLKDILGVTPRAYTAKLSASRVRALGVVTPASTLMSALGLMKTLESHILQVQTSDGVTVGVIMLEDVLEELVGPISQVR